MTFDMIERQRVEGKRRSPRKLIGVAFAGFAAGVSFGRGRRDPTPEEFEVWDNVGGGKEFRSGLAHGRTLDPVLEQADLFGGASG